MKRMSSRLRDPCEEAQRRPAGALGRGVFRAPEREAPRASALPHTAVDSRHVEVERAAAADYLTRRAGWPAGRPSLPGMTVSRQ